MRRKPRIPTMRVVVIKEGDIFVGQCLEHDICAQGKSMDEMLERLAFTVSLEKAERNESLVDIGPAPEAYHEMWVSARRFQDEFDGYELALAA